MAKRPRVPDVDLATPTQILLESPRLGVPVATVDQKTVLEQPAPEPPRLPPLPSMPPRAATLQMISMKTPAELAAETAARHARPVQVQLRSIAEAGRHYPTPPGGLGYLAPPRDPATDAKRASGWLRGVAMVIAGLALATAIATAMWFLA